MKILRHDRKLKSHVHSPKRVVWGESEKDGEMLLSLFSKEAENSKSREARKIQICNTGKAKVYGVLTVANKGQ